MRDDLTHDSTYGEGFITLNVCGTEKKVISLYVLCTSGGCSAQRIHSDML